MNKSLTLKTDILRKWTSLTIVYVIFYLPNLTRWEGTSLIPQKCAMQSVRLECLHLQLLILQEISICTTLGLYNKWKTQLCCVNNGLDWCKFLHKILNISFKFCESVFIKVFSMDRIFFLLTWYLPSHNINNNVLELVHRREFWYDWYIFSGQNH